MITNSGKVTFNNIEIKKTNRASDKKKGPKVKVDCKCYFDKENLNKLIDIARKIEG